MIRQVTAMGVAAALVCAGCTSLAPTYERPLTQVAPTFPANDGANVSAAPAAAGIAWQQYFTDPRLKELIELALANNTDLRVAILNIEQARAQWQVQRSYQVPSVNAAAYGDRLTNASGGITSSYVAGLNVPAFELDFFGRVANLSDAALARYLATEEARKTVQIALISTVASGYLALRADIGQIQITQQTLATRDESLKLTKLKFDNGVASELDVVQAASLVEGARVALQVLRRQRMQDENGLVLLIGRPVSFDLPTDAALTGVSIGPDLPAGLPSDLLANRPDIRQAEQQLKAANANIGAARAAFFPRITLTGSAGIASGDLVGLFNGGSLAWSFMPQLVLPIFDGGYNQANLEIASAQQQINIAQYQKTVQTAFREVADALAGRATLGDQLTAQRAQAAAEAARFKLADMLYRNGVSSYLDVLEAQRSLFVAQLATVQVQTAQLQNQVTLYKVLGGGWTDPGAK